MLPYRLLTKLSQYLAWYCIATKEWHTYKYDRHMLKNFLVLLNFGIDNFIFYRCRIFWFLDISLVGELIQKECCFAELSLNKFNSWFGLSITYYVLFSFVLIQYCHSAARTSYITPYGFWINVFHLSILDYLFVSDEVMKGLLSFYSYMWYYLSHVLILLITFRCCLPESSNISVTKGRVIALVASYWVPCVNS